MDKKGSVKPKIIAGIVTVSIIALLLIAGPVQAFGLDLDLSDTSVPMGTSVMFSASAIFESGDNLNISYFILDLDGPVSISCAFMPDGTPITSCNGITIEKIHEPNQENSYGYGYGYGYGQVLGNYTYKITLSTLNYPLGTYATRLIALTTQGPMTFQGEDLTIFDEEAILKRCSIRADDGEMELLGITFGDENHFSFYNPQSGESHGQGSIVGEFQKKRFYYKFQTLNIIDNNPNQLIVLVEGKYKVQTGPYKENVQAVLYIDKNTKLIDIKGSDFEIEDAVIDFFVGCD